VIQGDDRISVRWLGVTDLHFVLVVGAACRESSEKYLKTGYMGK
jgi:hypothetical protein